MAKLKVIELEAKRESKLREFYTIVSAIPQTFEKKAFSLTGKHSKGSVSDVFPAKKVNKPKTKTVDLECVPAKPENKQNNNQRKN